MGGRDHFLSQPQLDRVSVSLLVETGCLFPEACRLSARTEVCSTDVDIVFFCRLRDREAVGPGWLAKDL